LGYFYSQKHANQANQITNLQVLAKASPKSYYHHRHLPLPWNDIYCPNLDIPVPN